MRKSDVPETLAELVWKLPTLQERRELDKFRAEWEHRNRKTVDLTRRYTSLLSEADQHWIAASYPSRFVEGLPEFAREYLLARLERARATYEEHELPHHIPRFVIVAHREGAFAAEEERARLAAKQAQSRS